MENNNKEEQKEDPATPTSLSDQIATAALSAFASLPKTGKPQSHEHTAFAAIAITFPPHAHAATCLGIPNTDNTSCTAPLIITMATGTKCLPGSKRAADGSALNDCHAEVLARRAFLRWIYDEIQYAAPRTKAGVSEGSSPPSMVFSIKKEENDDTSGTRWGVQLLEGVQIHMFTSHPPCGDAAIGFAAEGGDSGLMGEAAAAGLVGHPQLASCACEGNNGGVGRTGAKPVIKRQKVDNCRDDNKNAIEQTNPTAPTDADVDADADATKILITTNNNDYILPQAHDVESYAVVQATGIVRRKPGRGEPTLSVSCSDKIAKWSLVGTQGALLSSIIATPLFFSSLVVGAPDVSSLDTSQTDGKIEENVVHSKRTRVVEMTENALKRAFQDRLQSLLSPPAPMLETHAVALDAFEVDKVGLLAGEVRRVPCGASITWRAAPSAQWRLKPAKQHWSGGGSDSSKTSIMPVMLITEGYSEAITGLFGCKAGAARRGADPVPPAQQSALCRAALFKRFIEISTALNRTTLGDTLTTKHSITYAEAKNEAGTASGYKARWNEITAPAPSSSHSPLEGWIQKPSLGTDFTL